MINPVNEQATPFAYTGDPVSGEGWLDTRRDVRNLIGSGPFNLQTDETKVVTLVWIVERGAEWRRPDAGDAA